MLPDDAAKTPLNPLFTKRRSIVMSIVANDEGGWDKPSHHKHAKMISDCCRRP
jgi:hypothetical protein